MWIIEVNFAGRQFTHRVRGRRRPWRLPQQLRYPRAA